MVAAFRSSAQISNPDAEMHQLLRAHVESTAAAQAAAHVASHLLVDQKATQRSIFFYT